MTICVNGVEPTCRAAPGGGAGPVCSVADPAMGPGADPDPVLGLPVDHIVPAFRAWPRMVRNLVGRKPGSAHQPVCLCIHVGGETVVSRQDVAPPRAAMEPCPRLDGQLVERHVVQPEIERHLQFPGPVGQLLALPCIDQVDGQPVECLPRGAKRGKRLSGGMFASQKGQRLVTKGLHAERQPVHPGRAEPGEGLGFGGCGICLGGDLDIGGEAEQPVRVGDDGLDKPGRHQAWRAASEKNAVETAAGPVCLCHMFKLPAVGAGESGMINLRRDMRIEITIGAFRPAKGPMDIEGEPGRGHGHGKQAATSLAKASARWPISSFSCGSISPKVRS